MNSDTARPPVLLVEDEALVRLTLTDLLDEAGYKVLPVGSAEEALEVLGAVSGIRAVVTDVKLSSSGLDGFELARKIHQDWGIGVLVMSGRTGPEADQLHPGVQFIAKPIHGVTLAHLVQGLTGSSEPNRPLPVSSSAPEGATDDLTLTPRQQEVLELLVEGKSNREIAEALGLSENTVKVHLAAIFRVLRVSSRVEAFLTGLQQLTREPYHQ